MVFNIIDRQCTVNVQPTLQGYAFNYEGRNYKRRSLESVHQFFLSQTQVDTVKLCFPDKKNYLHFTLDEPEKFTSKKALRRVLSQESQGAWIEEKNNEQRYFVDRGWLFSQVEEVSKENFFSPQSSKLFQRVSAFALGALALGSKVVSFSSTGLLGSALIQTGLAMAQIPIGEEFKVNTDVMGNQKNPRIAALIDDDFVVVWQGYQTGDWDVYGKAFLANGTNLDGEFKANTATTNDQTIPDIASLPGGGFAIVWQSGPNPNNDIYCRGYNASRAPIGVNFLVNTYTTNDQTSPAIEGLKTGEYVIVWQSQQSGSDEIVDQSYSASHVPIGSETPVNTITAGDQRYPILTSLKDGGYIIGWTTTPNGQSTSDIFGRRFNASRFALGIEFLLNNKTNTAFHLRLASLSNGGFIATWTEGLLAYNATGQAFDEMSLPVGSEFVIHNIKPSLAYDVQIVTHTGLPRGGFVIVWTDVYDNILGQIFDDVGLRVGPEFRVNTNTTGIQSYPDVAVLQDGTVVVVWMGDQTGDYDIYGQRFNVSGTTGISPTSSALLSSAESTTSSLGSVTPTISSVQVASSNVPTSFLPSSAFSSSSGVPTTTILTFQSSPSNSAVPSPSSLSMSSSMQATSLGNGASSSSQASATLTSQSSPINSAVSSPSSLSMSSSTQATSLGNGASSSSQAPTTLIALTSISYDISYDIQVNGVNVGSFTFSGGTGLIDGTKSNTITLNIDPDLVGETLSLFTIPAGQEGEFQTIELIGISCQSFDTQIVQDGSVQTFQAILQATTCTLATKLATEMFPKTMLKV